MVEPLKALNALPEEPGSIPSSHLVTHKYLQLQFQDLGASYEFGECQDLSGVQTYIQAEHPYSKLKYKNRTELEECN